MWQKMLRVSGLVAGLTIIAACAPRELQEIITEIPIAGALAASQESSPSLGKTLNVTATPDNLIVGSAESPTTTPNIIETDEADAQQELKLGLPERVEDCQTISSIDEILAVEREGFSFERDAPNLPSARFEHIAPGILSLEVVSIWNISSEENGFKPVSCTRLEVEGGYIYLIGFAIKNADNTTSFIHTFIGGEIDGKDLPIDYYKGFEIETTASELFQELRPGGNRQKSIRIARKINNMAKVEEFNNQYLAKLIEDQPELDALLKKAVREGKIPPELERLILPLFSASFDS